MLNHASPFVSIIMAVKDTEIYLDECLSSIISQTYSNWELIAVDDHSSDKSLKILRKYADKDARIKVFEALRHSLIPVLKKAYAKSQGQLINRMDSDDRMPPYKLEVMVAEWLKHGKGTLVAGGTKHFIKEGEVGAGFIKYENWLNKIAASGTYYENIYKECVIPSHCWLIHREDFDMVDGFEPEVYPEDYDLCFRFYKCRLSVVGLDKILHFWRDRPDRISRTWDCYKDNRYFNLKLEYFLSLDRDKNRPLVLWGAGKNGKDFAKLLIQNDVRFTWICNSERKIGKHIYNILLEDEESFGNIIDAQIIVVVSAGEDQLEIENKLKKMGKNVCEDYWFFI